MSDQDKNVHAVRTFADDLLKERRKDESVNTDTVNPTSITSRTPITLTPLAPKTPTKSAAEYLRDSAPTTSKPGAPTPSAAYRAAPVIPKTAVLGELEHVGRVEKTSILSDDGNLHGGQNDGVIIQDKKRDRFHLLPAVGKAMTGWAKEKQSEIVEAKQPVHTITKAEARMGTITAAAQSSKLVRQEDFASVAATIRAQERKTTDTKIIVKEKTAVPPPSWGYHTDDVSVPESEVDMTAAPNEEPVLEAPTPTLQQPAILSVTQKPLEPEDKQRFVTSRRKRPLPIPIPLTKTKSTTDPLHYAPRWNSEKDDAALAEDALRIESKLDVASARIAAAAATVPEELVAPSAAVETFHAPEVSLVNTPPMGDTPSSTSIPKPSEEFSAQLRQAAQQQSPQRGRGAPSADNGRMYVLIGGIFVLISLIVGGSLVLSGSFTSQNTTAPAAATPLIAGSVQSVSFDTFHDNFMRNIATAKTSGTGLRTLHIVNADETPANLRQVIEGLLPNASGILLRNTNQITLGYSAGNVPFIVIAAENYDSLFGGLLGSEPMLSRNLAPVFGLATAGTFTDTTILDRPARVLKDGQGSEVLFYVFLEDTIALITTSRTEAVGIAASLVH